MAWLITQKAWVCVSGRCDGRPIQPLGVTPWAIAHRSFGGIFSANGQPVQSGERIPPPQRADEYPHLFTIDSTAGSSSVKG